MSASVAEQEWAQTNGVRLHHWMAPVEIVGDGGAVTGVRFARQRLVDGALGATGEHETLAADMVFKAIGQRLDVQVPGACALATEGGRVLADDDGVTSVPGVWAGGDCRAGGRDLTVEAVEDGKRAARSIHAFLLA
jgi:glutamate synthase (NADPH/NADH) small chain